MGNLPTPADQAVAFEAAVRELSRMYPPPAMPSFASTSFPHYWKEQHHVHERMIEAARYGKTLETRMWGERTRIPKDELEAVIALIYG